MVVLNKLRVKNIEYDKCKFIFKLKYFVCVSWLAWLIIIIIIILTLHFYVEQSQVTCRYIIHIIMPSWSDLGITTYQDGCCSRILLFGFLGPVRDVSVAFVIRRGGALWRISELLSQLIFSMRSGMFFFDCNS